MKKTLTIIYLLAFGAKINAQTPQKFQFIGDIRNVFPVEANPHDKFSQEHSVVSVINPQAQMTFLDQIFLQENSGPEILYWVKVKMFEALSLGGIGWFSGDYNGGLLYGISARMTNGDEAHTSHGREDFNYSLCTGFYVYTNPQALLQCNAKVVIEKSPGLVFHDMNITYKVPKIIGMYVGFFSETYSGGGPIVSYYLGKHEFFISQNLYQGRYMHFKAVTAGIRFYPE